MSQGLACLKPGKEGLNGDYGRIRAPVIYGTAKRIPLYKKLLEFAGIEPERFYMQWVSASEGAVFTRVVKAFTETLRNLPPMKERLK